MELQETTESKQGFILLKSKIKASGILSLFSINCGAARTGEGSKVLAGNASGWK